MNAELKEEEVVIDGLDDGLNIIDDFKYHCGYDSVSAQEAVEDIFNRE